MSAPDIFHYDMDRYDRLKDARADVRKVDEGKVYDTVFLAQAKDRYVKTRLLIVRKSLLASGLIGFSVQQDRMPDDTADFNFDSHNMWDVLTYTDPTGFTIAEVHMGEGFFLPRRDKRRRKRGEELLVARALRSGESRVIEPKEITLV